MAEVSKVSTIKDKDNVEHEITAANLKDTNVGSTTKGVYINANGVPTATTYAVNKDVPADAVFTDTNTTYTMTSATVTSTGAIPYIEEESFDSGVLTLKTSYLKLNSSD